VTKVLEGLSWKFGFEDVVSSGPNKHTSFVAWYLITGQADDGYASLIFLFQCAAQSVGTLLLDELSEVLDLLIGRVLRDAKIKLDGFGADTSTGADGHA
jgi:hypothetical protein